MHTEDQIAYAIDRLNAGDIIAAESVLTQLGNPTTTPLNFHLAWGLVALLRGDVQTGLKRIITEVEMFPSNMTAVQVREQITQATIASNNPLEAALKGAQPFKNRYDMLTLVPPGGVVVEIGVLDGGFSLVLLERLRPKKMYLIDPWLYANRDDATEATQSELDNRYVNVYQQFRAEISAGKVELIRAKSADVDNLLSDNSIDFFYIDGDHTHEAVEIDLDLAKRKTRHGGLIGIDDYAQWWPGVLETVNKMLCTSPAWFSVAAVTANRGSSENILLKRLQ